MKLQKLFCALIVLAIAGCAGFPFTRSLNSKMGGISVGMSKQQVNAILGPPDEAATGRAYQDESLASSSEVHRYIQVQKDRTNDCIIVYHRNQVVEYGPYVGRLRSRYDVFKP